MRKFLQGIAGVLILFAVPFIALPAYNKIYHSDKQPPPHIKTITDFRRWQPTYTEARKVEIQRSTFFVVTGEYSRALPSAKAEYYFDSQGVYLNWNQDPGDLITLPLIQDNSARHETVDINMIGK